MKFINKKTGEKVNAETYAQMFAYKHNSNWEELKEEPKRNNKKEDNPENEEPEKGIPLYVFILSIVGIVIVLSIGFYFLSKFYLKDICFRKKRENELTNDDSEYDVKDEEIKGNELISNKDKLGLDAN